MDKVAFLDGYMAKVGEDPMETKRQQMLAWTKQMAEYRKRLAAQNRKKLLRQRAQELGKDFIEGADVDPGLRKRLGEETGVFMETGEGTRSLSSFPAVYSKIHKPIRPKL